MKVLLDTHAFLWLVNDDPGLPGKIRRLFEDEGNDFLLSIVSVWEMAIKSSLGKLTLPKPLNTFLPNQLAINAIESLELTFRHTCRVEVLPFHHRDPFDRLLAAQCLEEGLPIMSADKVFDRYEIKRIW